MTNLTARNPLCLMRLSTLCLLIGICASGRAQFLYTTNGNGSIVITGYNGTGGAVAIPSLINDRPVVQIARDAFAAKSTITSIAVPASITNIGLSAFASSGLTNISVDPGNQGYSSFSGVLFDKPQAMLVEFPAGAGGTYIVPQSVISVADQAFSSCTLLTNIVLPPTLHWIGSNAFSNCTGLTSVNIPDGVESIPYGAFANCSALTRVVIPASVANIGPYAFTFCGLTEIDIPEGTVSIDTASFANATKLTRVRVSKTVESVGTYAFVSCTNLTEIYFEGDCPSLGAEPFGNTPKLTVYYSADATGWTSTFGTRPAVMWNATISRVTLSNDTQVILTITGAAGLSFVVQKSRDLQNSNWSSIHTNRTSDIPIDVSDTETLSAPAFYRLRSP
jgi:hypothetical protein